MLKFISYTHFPQRRDKNYIPNQNPPFALSNPALAVKAYIFLNLRGAV